MNAAQRLAWSAFYLVMAYLGIVVVCALAAPFRNG